MMRLNDALATTREQIARLDALSRERALTDRESRRLGTLLYRERYELHRPGRRAA